MIRAKPSVPVIRPNWRRFPNSVFGALNLGVFVAFKASTRNETRVETIEDGNGTRTRCLQPAFGPARKALIGGQYLGLFPVYVRIQPA